MSVEETNGLDIGTPTGPRPGRENQSVEFRQGRCLLVTSYYVSGSEHTRLEYMDPKTGTVRKAHLGWGLSAIVFKSLIERMERKTGTSGLIDLPVMFVHIPPKSRSPVPTRDGKVSP